MLSQTDAILALFVLGGWFVMTCLFERYTKKRR
jgi:hypothetical protein